MSGMFQGCSSLTNINLYNFNANNNIDMRGMFGRCKSLKKKNIIIKNNKILNNDDLFLEFKFSQKNK